MSDQRTEELLEAIRMLHSINKSAEFIAHQVDLSPAAVRGILKTGKIPAAQLRLFAADGPVENE